MRALFRLYGRIYLPLRIALFVAIIGYEFWKSDLGLMPVFFLLMAFEMGNVAASPYSEDWIGWAYIGLAFAAVLFIPWFV